MAKTISCDKCGNRFNWKKEGVVEFLGGYDLCDKCFEDKDTWSPNVDMKYWKIKKMHRG